MTVIGEPREISVKHEEIVDMLERAADSTGLTLREFYEEGRADALGDPTLRGLWLIWGDVLTEDDIKEPEPA